MSDPTPSLSHRHGEFEDGRGNPLPFALFGMDDGGIDAFIEHCDRDEALEAGRREVEAEIDRDYVRRMIARDQDAAQVSLQVRPSDLPPAMTFDELCAIYGVSTDPTQHFAETWLTPTAITTSMKQAEVLGRAIDAVLSPNT